VFTIYNIKVYIGTGKTGDTWTYAEFGDGIENIAEALNEVVHQYQFISNGGFAKNHVTGAAPAWTLTGRRIMGDAAQDYIFSKKYAFDTERQSSLKVEYTDASGGTAVNKGFTVPCTFCNLQEFSGAATDDSAISMELRFDGKPTPLTA
jgi:hypothetical protein